jgi:site-specific recombinase XerD
MSHRRKSLFETFESELKLRGYSPRTIKTYLGALRRFVRFFHPRHPRNLTAENIRSYLLYLIEEKKASRSTINQTISALRFLYVELYRRSVNFKSIKRPKKEHKLPIVLSRKEIARITSAIENQTHRLIIELIYGSGLRVSEAVRLRVQEVNLDELTIFVRGGKGRKDRITVLSPKLVEPLRRQMESKAPSDYLFPGRNGHLSTRSVQQIFERALKKAGVQKKATVHALRHSFATHLLEAGTDIRYIKELLGHKRLETTRIYTKVMNPAKLKIKSPL